MKWRGFILWLILFGAQSVAAQDETRGNLRGRVTGSEENLPLVGATVLLQGTVCGTTTDINGKFLLNNIPAGNYVIIVSMVGYKRTTQECNISQGNDSVRTIVLESAPVQTSPVVVTASKRDQSLEEVPTSISVIDEKTLSYRDNVTIDQALNYVPGVNVTHSQVNVRGSSGYSYGVGTRVLMLVDGEPLLSGDTGEIVWESIPAATIDRVEVVKGAGSALYGSSALGGVINVITKKPSDRAETHLRLYGGYYEMPDYTQWRWSNEALHTSGVVAAHRQKFGALALSVGGSRTLDDGYKKNDFVKRWNVWSRLGYDLSTYQSVDVSFSLLDQRRGNFLYWKDINHVLEPKDDQLSQRVQSLRWSLSGGYRLIISPAASAVARGTLYRSRWENNIASRFTATGDLSQSDSWVSEIQINYQPSVDHILTGGITASFNDVHAGTIFGTHTAAGGALYMQDEIQCSEKARLTVGGRYDYQKLAGADPYSQVNPKFGIVYIPTTATSLRASVGSGFRAPSIAEVYTTTEAGGLTILPNINLKSEKSWSYEIGVMQTMGSNLTVDVALFRNEFWDMIEPSFASDGYVHFQNITRARITGSEVSFRCNALNGILPVQASYTYVYPEDVSKHDILKYRPRHLATVSFQGIFHPVTIGVDFRFLSRTERIDDELVLSGTVPNGDQRAPIYLTDLHLSANWRFAGLPITSTVHVRNLFQYYYADFIGNLGPLRSYELSLESVFP